MGDTDEVSTWKRKKLGDEQPCDKAGQWRQIRVPSDGVTAKSARSGGGRVHHDFEGSGRGGSALDTGVRLTYCGQPVRHCLGKYTAAASFNEMQPVYCSVN